MTSPGPALSVIAFLHADEKLLLIRRGVAPYVGSWAPPGGFVEPGESLECAIVREVEEEIGIRLDPERFIPYGLMSLPKISQVVVAFIARLDGVIALSARPPEVLEVGWFAERELPVREVWAPAVEFEWSRVYERFKNGRNDFYQLSDHSLRVITPDGEVQYLWRRS
jgi:ADP-ribose pyrophosphatase YjhB (NUDIX family)